MSDIGFTTQKIIIIQNYIVFIKFQLSRRPSNSEAAPTETETHFY